MSSVIIEVDNLKFPSNLYYSDTHIWVKHDEEGTLTLGMDDLGQKLIGKISIINLLKKGHSIVVGKVFGTMESMKWVERLKSPITGTIIEINTRLLSKPQILNNDPYGIGWMIKIEPTGNINDELLKLVTGKDLRNWIMKEIQEKGKLIPK